MHQMIHHAHTLPPPSKQDDWGLLVDHLRRVAEGEGAFCSRGSFCPNRVGWSKRFENNNRLPLTVRADAIGERYPSPDRSSVNGNGQYPLCRPRGLGVPNNYEVGSDFPNGKPPAVDLQNDVYFGRMAVRGRRVVHELKFSPSAERKAANATE